MHYNGASGDFPIVDNVVHLSFAYFGDRDPPVTIPPPAALDDPNPSDEYGAGENCLFTRTDGELMPRLPTLGDGAGDVELTAAIMTDGPWCPNSSAADRFDADLLRIDRVRVRLRVQAAAEIFRGPAGALFSHGGTGQHALRMVPDWELRWDVSPRNLGLGR
jgi:hypothetical protein